MGEVRALSGDGRWAASCGWHSDRVRLWNVDTGQMVHEWVVGKQTTVFFTPDSRALIISRGDEFSFWDVETLQPIRRLSRDVAQFPGHVAFSPDGRLMALEMAPAVIHLKEVATGRTVAKLEDPHGDRATWQGFTPDGTQLVVVASYASAIHIWDLRAIRTRLKDMNLDWDWPEFPPAAAGNSAAEPVTIEVLRGDGATSPALTREQRTQQAIERWRREVEATPDSGGGLQQPGLGVSDGARGAARRGGGPAPGRESGAAGFRQCRVPQHAGSGLLPCRPLSRGGGGPPAQPRESRRAGPGLRSVLLGHEPPPPGRSRAGPRLLRLGGPLGPDATSPLTGTSR